MSKPKQGGGTRPVVGRDKFKGGKDIDCLLTSDLNDVLYLGTVPVEVLRGSSLEAGWETMPTEGFLLETDGDVNDEEDTLEPSTRDWACCVCEKSQAARLAPCAGLGTKKLRDGAPRRHVSEQA